MTGTVKLKVRYSETDRMGIVYHANYYPWFELGRLAILEEIGLSYAAFEEMGLFMPLTETHCKHIRPCTFYDEITVKARLVKLTPVRCAFEYEVFKEDGLIAVGKTVHAFTDSTPKVISLKKVYPGLWDTFTGVLEEKQHA